MFVKRNKDPNNRLSHLKDKQEILTSIRQKMHIMSRTTTVKQVTPTLKFQANITKSTNNLIKLPQSNIFEGQNIPIETRDASFDTGMLNLEINELEEKSKEIKDKITAMNEKEAIRMKRQFRKDPNNYMARYRVTQEIVNNALGLNPL